MHFLKTPLFHYALLQKAEPNSPLEINPLLQTTFTTFFFLNNKKYS